VINRNLNFIYSFLPFQSGHIPSDDVAQLGAVHFGIFIGDEFILREISGELLSMKLIQLFGFAFE